MFRAIRRVVYETSIYCEKAVVPNYVVPITRENLNKIKKVFIGEKQLELVDGMPQIEKIFESTPDEETLYI